MKSLAHRNSEFAVLDPAYSTECLTPHGQIEANPPCWLYGQYECESFLLAEMIRRKNEAKLKVGYPGEFRSPCGEAFFRASLPGGILTFRAVGKVEVKFEGRIVFSSEDSSAMHKVQLSESGEVIIRLSSGDIAKDVPAFLPEKNDIEWEYSRDDIAYGKPVLFPRLLSGVPPHKAELPQLTLHPRKTADGLHDAGVELLAYVELRNSKNPELYVGESLCEVANENPEHFEQSLELVKCGEDRWKSKVPLALRYVRVKNAPGAEVILHALFHPVIYKGAFAHEDAALTKIWMNSAYTLHLCMHNFLIDGIKRDRLPWGGDLAVSLLSNCYSFADARLVRDSISVLESAGIVNKDINGIADYSLWLLVNHDFYQLYFGDMDFLRREYPRIVETVEILLGRCDGNGFLTSRCEWVFIDWVKEEKFTALQMLLAWGLKSAASLARRMDDKKNETKWFACSERVAGNIKDAAFDSARGLFTSTPGGKQFSRHPNIFAVVTGLVSGSEAEKIAVALAGNELPPVGTPYVSVFEAMALGMTGNYEGALAVIHNIWGGMLKQGATSFYEAYNPDLKGEKVYEFYERPFGLSCCHAWGAGPVFLLPQMLCGIKPLEDGWKRFSVNVPSCVRNIAAAVPTPYGLIQVDVKDGKVTISHPETVICG